MLDLKLQHSHQESTGGLLVLLISAAVALLEEVLHRCTIRAGRGDICIVAVAACLSGKARGR